MSRNPMQPDSAHPLPRGRSYLSFAHWRDAGRRTIMLSACAIPGHLAVGAAKTVLLVQDFSAFLTVNVLFTLGQAVVKIWVVRAARADPTGRGEPSRRAYRSAAILLLCLSVAYLVSCLPIAIAAISFLELGLSVVGLFSSRRRGDLLMETVKLTSLAASMILMVLTQTAVLSFAEAGIDHSRVNGRWGAGVGAASTLIALGMLWRAHRLARHASTALTEPGGIMGGRSGTITATAAGRCPGP